MRAVVQRVSRARVSVEGERVGAVDRGLCVLVGVARDDAEADAAMLADKVAGMRVFEDDTGRMNLGVKDVGGSVLAVSQFTLLGDMRKGKRPGFGDAMDPACAERLFELFCERVRGHDLRVETGRFRTRMQVELVNEGPVTLLIDTKKKF